ncbi:MAG: HupE/UreJ family protein [Cellvibrionaceae bacterium]
MWPAPPAFAHDIPSRVTLHAYVKPEGNQLNVLVRVPMAALSEIDFPQRGLGYLHFAEAGSAVEDAAQTYISQSLRLYENGVRVDGEQLAAARVDLPSDRSFTSYQTAMQNVTSPPLTDDVDLYWSQGLVDVLVRYPIASEDSNFAFESELSRLGMETNTVLRFVLPDGTERVFNYLGNPGLVELDPSLFQALSRFTVLGFFHILEGIDHLLFLFCLIIPLRSVRALIPVVTAFTIAHSITLIGSAFGITPNVGWFPSLIETLIALSIVYMACENILGAKLRYRWLVTFGFGLVHGFGFSFLLADTMQFAGSHLITSLLAFNIGVELGQLLVLVIAVPVLVVFFKYFRNEKLGVILLSAFIAHSAWHWMTERGSDFLQYTLQWPAFDALFFAGLMRWMILLMIAGATAWALLWVFKRFSLHQPPALDSRNT